MRSNRPFIVALIGLLVLAVLVLASCSPTYVGLDTGPRAWVGGPPDGSEVPVGSISAMCHGYAGGGVSHLELWVNGAFANRAANTTPGSEYFTASMPFETTGPGRYVVHCRTYGQGGGMAQSDPVTLIVPGEAEPSPTAVEDVPTATPTSTEVPPTVTVPPPPATATSLPPTATRIPPSPTRIPPTSTPPPPSPTREPPRITSFEVSRSQITLGECVTFSYVVAGSPDAIFFDGEGVAGPSGTVDRCPTATREYELTAEVGGQVGDRATVTVVVRQPSPTVNTGPSITKINESTNDVDWPEPYCTQCQYPGEVTISASISDPDGVAGAKVTYRINATGGQWRSLPMSQGRGGTYFVTLSGESLQHSLNPPVPSGPVCSTTRTLQYYIQAYDGLNNYSESPWGAVTVHYCYVIK
jgi:hypothetical protein